MTFGIMFGKFMPPTRGHAYAIEYALSLTSQLLLVVGDRNLPDTIPLRLREEWLRSYLGGRASVATFELQSLSWKTMLRLRHHTLQFQHFVAEHAHGQRVDYVFGGEWYTRFMAHAIGAKASAIGNGRGPMDVHARVVRSDPQGRWTDILQQARPFFLRETILVIDDDDIRRHFKSTPRNEQVMDVAEQLGARPEFPQIRALAAATRAVAQRSVIYLCTSAFASAVAEALTSPDLAIRSRYSAGLRTFRVGSEADPEPTTLSAAAVVAGRLPDWPSPIQGSPR